MVPSPARTQKARSPIHVSTSVDESRWDAFVSDHPAATVDHLWRWRAIFERVFGHECAYLAATQDEAVIGVLPLVLFRSRLFGRFVVSLPFLNYGGLLVSDDAAVAPLVQRATEVAETFNASHIELRHQQQQLDAAPVRAHKLALTLSLPQTGEALWAAIDRKVRNQIRKAQKENLEAASGGTELVDEFYRVFARNMRDLGTPVYSKALFSETLCQLGDRSRVFVVRRHGQAIAASIALRFRDTVLVPWASSLREYRNLCPNMLLYWSMLDRAVQDGIRTFDFGRSSRGAGTHQFKLQWGARESPLHWEYVLLSRKTVPDQGPSSSKFSAAIEVWKRLPVSLTNLLGPSIVRNIP